MIRTGKRGPAPKIQPDEKTLKTVEGLGRIQATHEEIAAVLGVCEKTWHTTRKKFPELDEALARGMGLGKVSLRRQQFEQSKRDTKMSIWLGRQYLEQTDKTEHSGPGGGPIEVTNARDRLYDLVLRRVGTSRPEDADGDA